MTAYFIATILAMILPVIIIVRSFLRGNPFMLTSVYSAIIVIEIGGGALKKIWSTENTYFDQTSQLTTLFIAWCSYCIFLMGYYVTLTLLPGNPRGTHLGLALRPPTWLVSRVGINAILMMLAFTIAIGLVQQYQRIVSAGGVVEFTYTAFQHRTGTHADSIAQNSFIVVANLVGGTAVAFACVGVVLWVIKALSPVQRKVFIFLIMLLILRQWTSMFRSTLFFTCAALFATYGLYKGFRIKNYILGTAAAAVFLLTINAFHQWMYAITAGWERRSATNTLSGLLAPQGQLDTLGRILEAKDTVVPLHGKGLVESVFFFIPRTIWENKAEPHEYGSYIVQSWAGLPNWYQMAVTNVGEMIAHFGYAGILLISIYGIVYALITRLARSHFDILIAIIGVLLTRVLVDTGMGISALAVTIVYVTIYIVIFRAIEFYARQTYKVKTNKMKAL